MEIIVKNLLISYSEKKTAGEKCLLFLHGWRSNKEVWAEVIKKIENEKVSVYALDLPGFGSSPLPNPPHKGEGIRQGMSVEDYAEVVKEFIEKMGLKEVVIVGHSFGGRIGIKLASKYPNLISKLVLVDSAGFVMPANKKNIFQIFSKLVKPFFQPKFMHGLRAKIYKLIGSEDYLATPELQKTFLNVVSEDLSEDMRKINIPTLIVTGENDQDTPVWMGKKMQSLISNSKFQVIKNAGHFSFLDKPEEFVKILQEFIK